MFMQLNLPGFKQQDDITIMNTISRNLRDGDGKFHELLTLVYKDNTTGIKHKVELINPQYPFYIVNEDKRVRYNRMYVPKEDCTEVVVKHFDVDRECAKRLGKLNWYNDCVQSGNRKEAKKIHMSPDLFMSDINIEDYYRFIFADQYKNTQSHIALSYFDIEADTIDMMGDFPEMGECPVNAITIIMQDQMQVYTFLLRNPQNPQIAEFEKYICEGPGLKDLHDFVYQHVIENRQTGEFSNPSLGVENLKYKMLFYDNDKEIDLIADLFKAINTFQPDFVLAWNEAFDIPYLIARCKALGYDPAEIMCHPDFQYKITEYYVDERAKNEPAERCDYAIVSGYSVFLDQMIHFASRRKGQTKYASMSLDAIGEAVCKVRKLDYKDFTTSIAKLPYVNYKMFVFYNVCDVVSQYCIENTVEDIDYVFGKVLMNNTRYSKVHRQTVYLANRGLKEFWNDGFIMGNNVNKWNDPPTEKFGGAFVGDPHKVSDYGRMIINNHPVNLFDNCDDFDYKSLYPSMLRQFNIFSYNQIGKIIIPNHIHDKEDKRHIDHWDRGGAFIEDFQSYNWLEFGSRWFSLPDYAKLVRFVYNLFRTEIRPSNNLRIGDSTGQYYFPILIQKDYCPIIFDPQMTPELQSALKEWHDYVVEHPNQPY